jgi:hypothetical protein
MQIFVKTRKLYPAAGHRHPDVAAPLRPAIMR